MYLQIVEPKSNYPQQAIGAIPHIFQCHSTDYDTKSTAS